MTELKSAGYFRELTVGDPAGRSLAESRADAPQSDEDAIVAYLEACPTLMWMPELARDVLDPTVVIGNTTIQTDGVWDWPADLAYYVRTYHVRVEPEFVAHMASRGWRAPAESEVDIDGAALLGITLDNPE